MRALRGSVISEPVFMVSRLKTTHAISECSLLIFLWKNFFADQEFTQAHELDLGNMKQI
jgi:hypothetical protein